ncbi:hypothetical protein GCM10020331_020510 [Ectobacillus funiculus]
MQCCIALQPTNKVCTSGTTITMQIITNKNVYEWDSYYNANSNKQNMYGWDYYYNTNNNRQNNGNNKKNSSSGKSNKR